ncbi:hypothetical protein [Georgenia subflava]|uniref:Uncharacterized protein n=1 Tax=Georgenia subflava TaxID=1622177 RepID=A0A6N7EP35_9MICO|nr:hypothetical protein [Georgenia subflava]MPV36994.1 hypothetical protein [Georgenia subflava]
MATPAEEAGEQLSKTTLRDFGPPIPHEERDYGLPSCLVTLSPQEAPIGQVRWGGVRGSA